MKYIECNTMEEAQVLLAQIRAEGNTNWADMHCDSETGNTYLNVPGCPDVERFGKPCCDKAEIDAMRNPTT